MAIYFHNEDVDFKIKESTILKAWIRNILSNHNFSPGDINIIFTSNDFLLNLNRKYLNHNYFTDVITFDYESENKISGDIFVSIDQVRLNAEAYQVGFASELHRVIIHGVLHLIGFNDGTDDERAGMRSEEDIALGVLDGLKNGKNL